MAFKRRSKKRNTAQVIILWFTLTVALGMMGVAVAAWQDGIGIGGIVSTGDIDPVFTSAEATDRAHADISSDRKTVSISIEDAYPGDAFCFYYTVTNRGSVPIRLYDVDVDADYGIKVNNRLFGNFIGGDGDSADGELSIRVEGDLDGDLDEPDAQQEKTYSFDLNLIFRQWNLVP